MASARTTYRDGHGGGGTAAAPFVWVSLRDPSPDELAAVQREFGLPAPLVASITTRVTPSSPSRSASTSSERVIVA
jgi:Mg2+ and Co2+ transporter CorA